MSMLAADIATCFELKSVLIATDFSTASEKALSYALSIARHYSAKLYLIHVVSSLGLTMAGPEAIPQATTAALRDATLTERELVSRGALSGIRHQVIVRQGDVWTELQAVMRDKSIDLLIVGIRGRTGFKRLVLGSVAEQIFRNASCRVLTVGPYSPDDATLEPGTPRPLLFATDFTEASLAALPEAVSLANQRRAKLVLFHAVSSIPQIQPNRWYWPDDMTKMQAATASTARKRLQQLVEDAPLGIEPECVTEVSEPAEGILYAARVLRPEIIIMGLKPRTFTDTRSHLPWSIAYDVVCGAVCPVLTVRSDSATQ